MRKHIMGTLAASSLLLIAGIVCSAQSVPGVSDTIVVNKSQAKKGVPLSGTITDAATKKGAAGVRVQVEDFSAAITDNRGRFTLNVPSYTTTVLVEAEGYDSRRIPLKGRKVLTLSLLGDDYESYNDQVTLPFGTQTKQYVTTAVGQHNLDGFTQPGETPDALLQGRVAGLYAIRRSGTQGAGANIFLRGYNSLYATNNPLVIVDGVLFDMNTYGESIIVNNSMNPLSLIDAKDIDNITVIKDASSIYGSKGSNGVIIITTSRAKSQATQIDFALYTGFNKAPKALPLMNASDYRTYLSEMLQSKGMTADQIAAEPYMNDNPANPEYADYHNNTNWQNKVLGNSMNQNIYLKIRGGDNIATYGLTLGFLQNEGIIRQTNMKRYNTRFNAEFNFTKRFTGRANLAFTYNEQKLKDQGPGHKTAPLFSAFVKAPFLTANEVNEKGVVSPNLADVDTLGFSNPSVLIDQVDAYSKYYRLIGSFEFRYEINKYLSASSMIGVQYDKIRENFFVTRKGVANDTLDNAIADSRAGTQVKRLFSLFNDTKLEYKRKISQIHSLGSRLGLRYQNNQAEQDYALGFNTATDNLVFVQSGLAALRQISGGVGDWNWLNVYANIDYGYREKLFLSLNAALDGSSRFGKQASGGIKIGTRKFPVFPSVSAAWLVSSEKFMSASSINLLKLRASYGMAGNDDIGNYSARRTYASQPFLGAQGLVLNGIANPTLKWETSRKINAGVDLSFWNERAFISVDAYQSTTSNMLVYRSITPVSGFNSLLTNEGKMQNRGIDLSLNVRILNGADLKWDAGINIGTYKNRILSVPGGQFTTDYYGATIITSGGHPANRFYGYRTDGIFASDGQAAAAQVYTRNASGQLLAFKGGDIRFVNSADAPGDTLANGTRVTVIDALDRQVIGDPSPDFTGGITNRLVYKRFELNALFTFSQGNDVYNYVRNRLEASSNLENQLLSVNNRWHIDEQVTRTPKPAWGDPLGNSRFSDRWIEDGSYFRLRTLSLQYDCKVRTGGFLKSLIAYATGNNLFTLTQYKGFDPEFSADPSVFSQGIDIGLDPLFRSVTLGVKIGL